MTDTVATPTAAPPTGARRKAASFDANPAKAGWATSLRWLCCAWPG